MTYQNKKTKNHKRFYCLLALLLGLCFTRYMLQIDIPQIALLAVVAMIACLGDQDEIIGMCLCCIPLHTSFHLYYALIICVVVYVLKYHQAIGINFSVMPLFLMMIWELLHAFEQDFSVIAFGSEFLPLITLTVIMCTSHHDWDYSFLVRAMTISIAAMCFLLLGKTFYVSDFRILVALNNLQRLGYESEATQKLLLIKGGEQNPNALGIMCVLGISGLMQLRFGGLGKKHDIFLIIGLLAFGGTTASRTFLACLVLMGMLLLLSERGSPASKLQFLFRIFAVLLIVLLLLYIVVPELMMFYISRFLQSDITGGRTSLMKLYGDFIASNNSVMLFGIGIQNYYTRLMNEFRVAVGVPHNAIQEIIIAWGLPGIGLFVLLGIVMLWCSHRVSKSQKLINYVPIIIILAKSMVGQLLDSPYTMLSLSYAYLSLCQDFRIKEER